MTSGPLVAFVVEGGPAVGMGHISRSVTLARTLEALGAHVRFWVVGGPAATGWVRGSGGAIDGEGDDPEPLGAWIAELGPDVVVVDRAVPAATLVRHLRSVGARRVLVLDCLSAEPCGADVVVNLLAPASGPPTRGDTYWEGPQYGILAAEYESPPAPSSGRSGLLVALGGSDAGGQLEPVVGAVAEAATLRPATVVLGPAIPAASSVIAVADAAGIEVAVAPPSLARLFGTSRLAIVAGGTTMLEAAAMGVPSVIVPRSADEARFASSIRDAGAAELLDHPVVDPSDAVVRAVSLWTDDERRRRASEAGRRLVDGRGRHRVAELVMALATQEPG